MNTKYQINIEKDKKVLINLINEVTLLKNPSYKDIEKLLRKYPGSEGIFSKGNIIKAYKILKHGLKYSKNKENVFIDNIRMKKIRSISGVTPVTVLTKPFPCPGKCIFCPNDVRMPKSYLRDEPGAQRAESNSFDPYLQTHNRLAALRNIGHPINKIELIILGGTWSSYPETYQIWFVKRCFDAMNDFYTTNKDLIGNKIEQPYYESKVQEINGNEIKKSYNEIVSLALKRQNYTNEKATWSELEKVHKENETNKVRCVGLVIETRPDEIDENEVVRIRKLGATKVQIGIQTLDDRVLKMNKRGHDTKKTATALKLLRKAGFKIHAHWMPNLYGSNPQNDKKDYKKLFKNKAYRPDEIKIYPCSLIESAELMRFYKKGLWKPYNEEQLSDILVDVFKNTPNYCRITRMIRDIPSTDIVVGNKQTNFRQVAESKALKEKINISEIRYREITDKKVNINELKIKTKTYNTLVTTEKFIEYVTNTNQIVAFLRLSMPLEGTSRHFIPELQNSAIIREIHVYGQAIDIGKQIKNKAQHLGLGKNLIERAKNIAKRKGFERIAVISSIGTREYYRKRGFEDKNLYQIANLK